MVLYNKTALTDNGEKRKHEECVPSPFQDYYSSYSLSFYYLSWVPPPRLFSFFSTTSKKSDPLVNMKIKYSELIVFFGKTGAKKIYNDYKNSKRFSLADLLEYFGIRNMKGNRGRPRLVESKNNGVRKNG